MAPDLAQLEVDEWLGPVLVPAARRYYFVYLDDLERPEKRSLDEAQLDIERTLRDGQRLRLVQQGFEELRKTASVTEEQRMATR